jgi:hypothetical protein
MWDYGWIAEEKARGRTGRNTQYSHGRIGGKGKTADFNGFEKTAGKRKAIRIQIPTPTRKVLV